MWLGCVEQYSAGRKFETSESRANSAADVREILPASRKFETSESLIKIDVVCRARRSAGRKFETSESLVDSVVALLCRDKFPASRKIDTAYPPTN